MSVLLYHVEIPNEEELITTVNYTLTPADGSAAITLSFVDLDGDGGDAPTITGGTLIANTTYTGTLELLNEAEMPVEDITTAYVQYFVANVASMVKP